MNIRPTILASSIAALLALTPKAATAADWLLTTGGDWATAANWSGGVPNAVDAVANFATNITADATINLGANRTVGTLSFGDPTPGNQWILANNVVIFDVSVGVPTVNVAAGVTAQINSQTQGNWDGGLNVSGGGTLVLNGGTLDATSVRNTWTVNTGAALRYNAAGALGWRGFGNETIVMAGGQLQIGASIDPGTERFIIAGNGTDGTGAIVNNTAGAQNATRHLTLSGNASVGGTQRFDVRNAGGNGLGITGWLDLGGFTLTKLGTNSFILNNATVTNGNIQIDSGIMGFEAAVVNGVGTVTVNAGGTFQVWRDGATRSVDFTRPIVANGGAFDYNTSASQPVFVAAPVTLKATTNVAVGAAAARGWLGFTGGISEEGGSFGLNKTGNNLLLLGGTSTYTGPTTINAGGIVLLPGATLGNTAVAVLPGATLAGAGSIAGGVNVDGTLLLGSAAGVTTGPLTLGGGSTVGIAGNGEVGTLSAPAITFAAGGTRTLNINLGATQADRMNALAPGGLILDGTNNLNFITGGAGWASGVYPLFGYNGPLGGLGIASLFNLTPTGRHTVGFNNSGTTIDLVVASPGNTVWTASTNGDWDAATANWQLSTAPGVPILFLAQDNVVFDDTTANGAVNLLSAHAPAGITFNNAATTYTLSGVGSITNGGLTKRGAGTATLGTATANTFVGPVVVEAGTLVLNYSLAAQLSAASTVRVANGATLRFAHADGDISIANTFLGSGTVELDPKTGGAVTGRSVTLTGTSSTFAGTWRLVPTAGGTMRLQTPKADQLGSGPIVIENGGQLYLTGERITNAITINGTPHNGGFVETNGTQFGALRVDNFSEIAGPVTVNGAAKISAHNSTGYVSGNISGGDVTFMGTNFANANTLILSGTNSYGATIVNGGSTVTGSIELRLIVGNGGNTGTLGAGPVTLTGSGDATNGASAVLRFDRTDGYVMVPGQTITGTGTLNRTILEFSTLGAGFVSNGAVIDLVGTGAVGAGGLVRVGVFRPNAVVTINSVLRAGSVVVGHGARNATLNLVGPANVSISSMSLGEFQNNEGGLGAVVNIGAGVTLNVAGSLSLGQQNGITGAVVNQAGGDVVVGGLLRIGHWPNETANYNLSGGTLTLTGVLGGFPYTAGATEVNGALYLGIDGQGNFTQTGGTVTTPAVVLDNRVNTAAGNNMTGTDTYTLSGGTLTLTDASGVVSRNASAAFLWNGGTIRAGVSTALDSDVISVNAPSTLDANGLQVTLYGPLAGSGGFNLTGAGILRVVDRNGGATTVAGGGTGGGSLGANGVNIGPGSTVIYDRTASVTWSGMLSGPGNLLKSNNGTLTLTGANIYTGSTTVDAGTLVAATGLAPTGTVVVNAGTFAAAGAVGALTQNAGSSIRPGASALDSEIANLAVPTLTVNGGDLRVNFNAGMTLNDKITVAGLANYTAASTITPTFAGNPVAGLYPVLTAGTLTLGVVPTLVVPGGASRFTMGLDTTSVPNTILVAIAGGPKNLDWTGAVNATWDTNVTQNWTDGIVPETFFSFDSVNFPDGPVNRVISIAAGGVNANAINFNNTAGNDYTINGPGVIAGGSITKSGNGTLTINTANTHVGATIINGGQVILGTNDKPLGTNPSVTVGNGATLNVNGLTGATATVRYDVSIIGDGLPGQAAIWNGGAGVVNNPIYRSITLLGDASMGGVNRYDLNGGTVGGAGVAFNGGTFTLRKVGPNEQWWSPVAGATVGNIVVDAGTFGVQSSNNLGSLAHSIFVNPGGQLVTFGAVTNAKPIILNGGLLAANNNTGIWTGPVTLNGAGTSNRIGTITSGVGVTLAGPVGGTEGFEKTGTGVVELQSPANNYAGTTLVSAGTLRVAAGGIVPPTTTLNLNGGVFDLNGSIQTVARLEGFAGTITSATAANLVVNQTTDTTLSAALNGLLALTKNGTGSLTLNAVSTTTGATTVNNGTLVVNAGLAGSNVAVNGGTLAGFGPLGPVNVGAGAVAPGSGPGTLASGNFSLTAASTLRFELALAGTPGGGLNDLISVTGNLTLDGTLAVTELPGFTEGIYRLFDYSGALTNNGLELESAFLTAHPGSFIDTTTAQQVNLVVVPEPGWAGLVAMGLGLNLARWRRRK